MSQTTPTEEEKAYDLREKRIAERKDEDVARRKQSSVDVARAKKRHDSWRDRGYSDGPPNPIGPSERIGGRGE